MVWLEVAGPGKPVLEKLEELQLDWSFDVSMVLRAPSALVMRSCTAYFVFWQDREGKGTSELVLRWLRTR